jgi:hypothetical protein
MPGIRRPGSQVAYGSGAAHPNYVSEDAGDRVRRFYGAETYARLVEVKRRWEPQNLFALNQNIRPSRGEGLARPSG